MSSYVQRVCQCGCGETFMARASDIKRGCCEFCGNTRCVPSAQNGLNIISHNISASPPKPTAARGIGLMDAARPAISSGLAGGRAGCGFVPSK